MKRDCETLVNKNIGFQDFYIETNLQHSGMDFENIEFGQ